MWLSLDPCVALGRGMHAQLGALSALVALVDPQLAAFLKSKGADNYFFCYRWLLIHFKRDFAFDEARTARLHPHYEPCRSLCCSFICRARPRCYTTKNRAMLGDKIAHWITAIACPHVLLFWSLRLRRSPYVDPPTANQMHYNPAHL